MRNASIIKDWGDLWALGAQKMDEVDVLEREGFYILTGVVELVDIDLVGSSCA